MSNIINSLNLTLNASKGYNPYRNADGTFANGPSAMGLSNFRAFSSHTPEYSNKRSKPVVEAKETLDGMLRMGVNIKMDSFYLDKVEAGQASPLAQKIRTAQSKPGGIDTGHLGEVLTSISKQLSKPTNDTFKATEAGSKISSTVEKKLQSLAKSFASKANMKGENAEIFNEIYGNAAAIANTLRAAGIEE